MANLGYQYDWPHRCYADNQLPMPPTVTQLTAQANKLYQAIRGEQIVYKGEAVIVNYYKDKDYMIGHLDDGEIDQVSPIFSFSLGLSCVFLIGGADKDITPSALKLETGDLLSTYIIDSVMSGQSRVCYHGVPRVIQHTYQASQQILQLEIPKHHFKNGTKEVINYLQTHRINLNVRQVYCI